MIKWNKFSVWVCACVLCVMAFLLPDVVRATDEQVRYCQGCQMNVALTEWVAIGGEQSQTLTTVAGTHYYLVSDLTGTPDGGILLAGSGCVDLNGFDITAGSECIAISCDAGTLNLMGEGTVLGTYTTASYGATIHTANSAVVKLYGGTYEKTGNNSAIYIGASCKVYMYEGTTVSTAGTFETYPTAVLMEGKSGRFYMYGGTIIGGTTTGNGGSIRVSNSSKCYVYGGTITGGQASRGGNIAVRDSGSLTVNGGTITSGTATQTYGGGNIYTNKCKVTINDGLITLGTATDTSYGGGNIGNFKGTLTINGGTISYGSAVNEAGLGGGNIYIEGESSESATVDALVNITDGVITDGQTVGSGGNICQKYGKINISGGTISNGSTTGTQTLGGGNVYILDAEMNMTDGTISGGTISAGNGGNILDSGNFVFDGGMITGGQGYRGGNIAVRDSGSLTVNGGTITSGTATQTYGGGNIYTNKCKVTINGGLITLGTATGTSYGGGNIGNYRGTLNINGGTISYGSATNENCLGGGNIYMEGAGVATLTFTAGTVTAGYIVNGNGHNIYAKSGILSFGSESVVGDEAEDTGGEMNVYLLKGDFSSAGSIAGGVCVEAGNASITGGKYYSFVYNGTGSCAITGGFFCVNCSEYVPSEYRVVNIVTSDEYVYAVVQADEVPDVVVVDKEGKEAYTFDPLTQFDPELHAYIKLYGDMDMGTLADQELWIDVNGKNLVIDGTGKIYAFDSANDAYDASACGTVTNNGTLEIVQDVHAPNGNRYIAITEETTTMHRLDMRLNAVSLRVSTVGIYYESVYNCDEVLASKVLKYGSVLSINNMPGADFLTEEGDINLYTVIKTPFQSGITTNSAIVNNILMTDRDADLNDAYSRIPIYANPYILLANGDENLLLVGDAQNAGKQVTDDDFTGKVFSLHDVMDALDKVYNDYSEQNRERLDDFYRLWKVYGVTWEFNNIGKEYTDNLILVDGQGYCQICKKTVTWTALDSEAYAAVPYGTAANGDHLYLAEDITYTGTEGSGFLIAPGTEGYTVCFHLNGHSLTATQSKALYGSAGVLNVMGSGTVAGYVGSADYGAAVQISSKVNGTINLYGGTYQHAENSATGSYVVAIRNYGGTINVYEDAHIDGSLTGKAAWTGTATYADTTLGLYNATVDGQVYIKGSTDMVSKLILADATVNGTVSVSSLSTVILQGAPVVELLNPGKQSLVTMDNMTDGADIVVSVDGCFTETNANAAEYAKYFQAANSGEKIVAVNDTLQCKQDYSTKLELDENNKGYCLVCKKTVTWEALTAADAQVQFTSGQHLYLTESLTYEETEGFFVNAPETKGKKGCLHLNGYDITATKGGAIYSGGGILNVMGGGTVTGYASSADQGAAVWVNSNVSGAAINIYSGIYKKYAGSDNAAGAVACGNTGGTLNLYPDAMIVCEDSCAVYMGACEEASAALNIDGTTIYGDVVLNTPADSYTSATVVDSADIIGALRVVAGTDVTLTGRPRIDDLSVNDGELVTLTGIVYGTDVAVSADGIFTEANEKAQLWEGYFTGTDEADWVVVREKALNCVQKTTLPNGGNVLVIGNSMTYYSNYVMNYNHTMNVDDRTGDQGYFYQICKANGVDVSVTNYTFPAHTLYDFYSGKCAANRGHNGYNHLVDLAGRSYDYVIFQEGNEAADKENIMAECAPLMELFLEQNPNTIFVFQVHSTVYTGDQAWRTTINELDQNGIIVADWGEMVYDLINGNTVVPNGEQTYTNFSFIVNKSATDGKHPNILSGYLAAQMTYCAITGESAVGQDYSFWNDVNANSAFALSSYLNTYYAYDKTEPSNTNFVDVFSSVTEMTGLQELIDQYLAEKRYMDN